MDDVTTCTRFGRSVLKTQRLRNPFLLKIEPSSLKVNNYVDGIELSVVCECSFWLFSFWGVKINEFHQKLALDWITIKNQLIDEKFIENFALYSNDPELYQDEYNKIIHKVKGPKDFDPNNFGSNQRDRYPLVVMLALNDREIEDQIEINDIVLLTTIIHIKDPLAPFETSIIAQYIKRKSGVILKLQDLYVSGDCDNDNIPKCVICLENDITRALLPCRHTCVCEVCFDQINDCPLCRSTITSFIQMNKSYDLPEIGNKESASPSPSPSNNVENQSWYRKALRFFIGK